MSGMRSVMVVAAAATLGASCARYAQSAAGDVIDPVAAAKTVVLDVENLNSQPMELRLSLNGNSRFIGSVGGSDRTSLLLDPSLFPAGFMYVVGVPADGRGRAIAGPLSAGKGDRIRFTIQPILESSRATVVRQGDVGRAAKPDSSSGPR